MGVEDPLFCDGCGIQMGFTLYLNEARINELEKPCPTCNETVEGNDLEIICMKCRLEIP